MRSHRTRERDGDDEKENALSPRDVQAKTAPATAQAMRPMRRAPTLRVAANRPAAKAKVPVIAHEEGFIPAMK